MINRTKADASMSSSFGGVKAYIRMYVHADRIALYVAYWIYKPVCLLQIIDLESGKPLGPNQNGEICGRGPVVMKNSDYSCQKYL